MNFKQALKSNPKLKFLIVIIVILFIMVTSFVRAASSSSSSTSAGGRKNYTKIYAVPGVSFEVSQELANYATAVMEISKDVDFIKNASYSYKNGTDTYMLFNMSQYIVIVQKGTSFDFQNLGVSESLEKNSLNGIWFSDANVISEDDDKLICDVSAQVVITNTIYNDFYGKLATITYNDEEWAMFAGSVYADDSSMSSMIDYTIATFVADVANVGENMAVYEVEVNDAPTLTVADVEEKVEVPVIEESSIIVDESFILESGETSAIEESSITEETAAETISEVSTESTTLEETTTEIESIEIDTTEAESTSVEEMIETTATEETVIELEVEAPTQAVLATNNQLKTEYKDNKAYTSTIYSMLDIGKIGYMTASNQDTGSYDEIFIRVESVNNEETTNALIQQHINSGKAYYSNMEAPTGTHWESVTYSVKHDSEKNYYTNILFVGMDGESLKHRGIDYSTRTYDITSNVKETDGWKTGYVSFYAVPNGCSDYSIACGDAVNDAGYKAYYKVEN